MPSSAKFHWETVVQSSLEKVRKYQCFFWNLAARCETPMRAPRSQPAIRYLRTCGSGSDIFNANHMFQNPLKYSPSLCVEILEFNFNIDMLGAREYKDPTGHNLRLGMHMHFWVKHNHRIFLVRALTILLPPVCLRSTHFTAVGTHVWNFRHLGKRLPIKLTVGIPPCEKKLAGRSFFSKLGLAGSGARKPRREFEGSALKPFFTCCFEA